MSPPAPQRKKPVQGPRYYRVPPVWGLAFLFLLVVILIVFLLRLG
jgi:hypothetical protein